MIGGGLEATKPMGFGKGICWNWLKPFLYTGINLNLQISVKVSGFNKYRLAWIRGGGTSTVTVINDLG